MARTSPPPSSGPTAGSAGPAARAPTPARADHADALVDGAFAPGGHAQVAAAIGELSPDEAAYFLHRLEGALRKRKLQLLGYLVAIATWLVGMVASLAYYGSVERGVFVGWVFLVPFGAVALVLWGFGAWAERVGKRLPPGVTPPRGPAAPVDVVGPAGRV